MYVCTSLPGNLALTADMQVKERINQRLQCKRLGTAP